MGNILLSTVGSIFNAWLWVSLFLGKIHKEAEDMWQTCDSHSRSFPDVDVGYCSEAVFRCLCNLLEVRRSHNRVLICSALTGRTRLTQLSRRGVDIPRQWAYFISSLVRMPRMPLLWATKASFKNCPAFSLTSGLSKRHAKINIFWFYNGECRVFSTIEATVTLTTVTVKKLQ